MQKNMLHKLLLLLILTLLPALAGAANKSFGSRSDVREFIDEMAAKHKFNKKELAALLDKAKIRPEIIAAISRPAESKPWYQYRPIFLTEKRIQQGAKFWNDNQEALARAEKAYGVPAEIVTAILGVETFYGKHKGGYRVLDSLSTLAFEYAPRGSFFRSELEQYLLMTREEKIDPLKVTGSYAGAMGKAQFISSSYRRYAVDFNNDGQRDLWDSNEDAIGSVANYLKVHGWEADKAITDRVSVPASNIDALIDRDMKPRRTIGELKNKGIRINDTWANDQLAALIPLELEKGNEYWIGMNNFYAITRYNHSALYAMAVYQLSQEIRVKRQELVAGSAD